MRKDSCRNCGILMQEFQRCQVCSKVTQFACSHCRRSSDEQVHPNCGIIEREVLLHLVSS